MISPGLAPAKLPDSYEQYRALVMALLREIFDPLRGDVYALDAYHLGWLDEAGNPIDQFAGKMLRPVLCLAACRGFGDPSAAVGPAAALELLHSFSLVHDDIEDGDRERHHRPTLWALAGLPLALNAGDSLFALACRALFASLPTLSPNGQALALQLFSDASLRLVEGQHLDITFESRRSVTLTEYIDMTQRKTGALIGAALALGALYGGATSAEIERFREAGVSLGVGFQAVDDMLAVWGDPSATGKAVGNDQARGKKSLPLVLAREKIPNYGSGSASELEGLRTELERHGIDADCRRIAAGYCDDARRRLGQTAISAEGLRLLLQLVEFVLGRQA